MPSKFYYALIEQNFYREADSDDGYNYSDSWVTDSVTSFATLKSALEDLRKREAMVCEGDVFEKSYTFYVPKDDWEEDDEEEEDCPTRVPTIRVRERKCTRYTLERLKFGIPAWCHQDFSGGNPVLHLVRPVSYNKVLSAGKRVFREGCELEDLQYYLTDIEPSKFTLPVPKEYVPLGKKHIEDGKKLSGEFRIVRYKQILQYLLALYAERGSSQVKEIKAMLATK